MDLAFSVANWALYEPGTEENASTTKKHPEEALVKFSFK
jgi:hypothetical protein